MTITLTPELETALIYQARLRRVTPEALAQELLTKGLAAAPLLAEPRDEWERQLRAIAIDCGVSLSNEAVSSEGIYGAVMPTA